MIAGCVKKVTVACATVLLACLAMQAANDFSIPSWAREADPESFRVWAETFAQGRDFSAVRANYSDQFLMNVSPEAKVLLNIDSIQVEEEGSIIVISATTNGVPMSLGVQIADSEDGTTHPVSQLNGILNVTVGDTLMHMKPLAVTEQHIRYFDGKARVTIPRKFGAFVKATVDYVASSQGTLAD